VDWTEINAALGHVVLLLNSMAAQTPQFKFQKCARALRCRSRAAVTSRHATRSHVLFPMGSFSKIAERKDLGTKYEL
jgi:hypothetical protein